MYNDKRKFIILVTGGRGGAKSFETATFIKRLSYQKGHTILFCRYTMNSAEVSVIPEFRDKIEREGDAKYFDVTKSEIINRLSGSSVLFRGIKTSSGNQTANLKSIQGLTTFVCDEAEEWTSETDYDKLVLSIRQKGIQNRIIIIMNPTDVNHFVYRKYIKDTHKLVDIDGVKVQISTHPNVLHIHTTYLDNLHNLSQQFLDEIEEIKAKDPKKEKKYAHVVIGRWADISEGAIFKNWDIVDEVPANVKKQGLGMDFGFTNDPTAIAECSLIDDDLWIDEKCYKTHMLTKEIISELKQHDKKIISESQDPRLIQEIANAGLLIYPVDKSSVKGIGSILAGITKMQDLNIHITKSSYNAISEFRTYSWDKNKDGVFINQPKANQDDHLIDAVRYWVLGELLGRIMITQEYSKEDLGLI